MTLTPKTRPMTREEFVQVMASGEWTWRCAGTDERDHEDWRLVQIRSGVEATPLIFLRVPAKDAVVQQ